MTKQASVLNCYAVAWDAGDARPLITIVCLHI